MEFNWSWSLQDSIKLCVCAFTTVFHDCQWTNSVHDSYNEKIALKRKMWFWLELYQDLQSQKNNFNPYLEPLVDELHDLWEGVVIMDSSLLGCQVCTELLFSASHLIFQLPGNVVVLWATEPWEVGSVLVYLFGNKST